MIDQAVAAHNLFPSLTLDQHQNPGQTTAVAVIAKPAAPAPAPSQALAKVETMAEQSDRLDRQMGLGKYTPGKEGAPAEAGVPAVAASSAVATVEYLNPESPEYATAAPALKELGVSLTKEQAGKLDALRFKLAEQAMDRQSAEWAAASKAHLATPTGKGDLADAQAALKQFGSPALISLLDASGFGNHPEVLKFCAKAFRSNPLRYGTR